MKATHHGFTLIELMMTIAVLGILASIALPQYQNYSRTAKFTEVIQATQPRKLAIELCYQIQGVLSSCETPATNGLPPDATTSGYVDSVTVTAGSVITATAIVGKGLLGETYVLTPLLANTSGNANALTWPVSGTCLTKNICK